MNIRRGLITKIAILFQSFIDNVFELCGKIRVEPQRSCVRSVQDRVGNDSGSFSTKRQRPGRHLVQHHSKREQISPRVQFLATHLLGRHISDSSQRAARTGQLVRVHSERGETISARCRAFC